jgi:hypothetical protein
MGVGGKEGGLRPAFFAFLPFCYVVCIMKNAKLFYNDTKNAEILKIFRFFYYKSTAF